jgi:hypothetical protein
MRKNGRQQHRMALVVNEGRKWTHVIFMEYPVQVEKVINNEAQRFDYVHVRDYIHVLFCQAFLVTSGA